MKLYDATFCETGSNGSGGNMGAGDHWIGGSPNGVTTVYSLWNENGTPYDISDDTQVATSGTTFSNEIQADYSGVMGTPSHTGLTDCSANAYHNAWYTLATGLAAGRYRVNVNTSSSSQQQHQRREHVLHLGHLGWLEPAGLRRGQDGCLQQPRRRQPALLPRPDRRGKRRQDDGDHALRPWRCERQRLPQDQVARRQQLQLRDLLVDR